MRARYFDSLEGSVNDEKNEEVEGMMMMKKRKGRLDDEALNDVHDDADVEEKDQQMEDEVIIFGQMRCYYCNQIGHLKADCPIKNLSIDADGVKQQQQMKCYLCAEVGHISKDCPKNLDAKQAATLAIPSFVPSTIFLVRNSQGRGGKGTNRFGIDVNDTDGAICLHCGEIGHFNCKWNDKKASQSARRKTCARCASGDHNDDECVRIQRGGEEIVTRFPYKYSGQHQYFVEGEDEEEEDDDDDDDDASEEEGEIRENSRRRERKYSNHAANEEDGELYSVSTNEDEEPSYDDDDEDASYTSDDSTTREYYHNKSFQSEPLPYSKGKRHYRGETTKGTTYYPRQQQQHHYHRSRRQSDIMDYSSRGRGKLEHSAKRQRSYHQPPPPPNSQRNPNVYHRGGQSRGASFRGSNNSRGGRW